MDAANVDHFTRNVASFVIRPATGIMNEELKVRDDAVVVPAGVFENTFHCVYLLILNPVRFPTQILCMKW